MVTYPIQSKVWVGSVRVLTAANQNAAPTAMVASAAHTPTWATWDTQRGVGSGPVVNSVALIRRGYLLPGRFPYLYTKLSTPDG